MLIKTDSMQSALLFSMKPNAAHVGGEVVRVGDAFAGALAVFLKAQVERPILNIVKSLVPASVRLISTALIDVACSCRKAATSTTLSLSLKP